MIYRIPVPSVVFSFLHISLCCCDLITITKHCEHCNGPAHRNGIVIEKKSTSGTQPNATLNAPTERGIAFKIVACRTMIN